MLPGVSAKRRVETVRLIASNINERSTSVSLDLGSAQAEASKIGVAIDVCVVSLIPKSLMYEFDIHDASGGRLIVVDRHIDSMIAMCFLTWLGQRSKPNSGPPGEGIWKCLYQHCYKFPVNDNIPRNAGFAAKLGEHLTGAEAEWWKSASSDEDWLEWLLLFHDMFILATPASGMRMLVKYRKKSGKDPIRNGPVNRITARPASSHKTLAVRLYDLGRAESEHVHVVAPPGTFLTPVLPFGRPRQPTEYRLRASRHEIVLYLRGGHVGNVLFAANLWPEPRQFLAPLRYIARYVLLLVLVASLAHMFDVARAVVSVADAYVAIAYFLPSLALGYIFRPGDDWEIRWDLQRPAREYVPWFLAGSLLASGSLLLPANSALHYVWGTLDFILFLALLLAYMFLERYSGEILKAQALATSLELAHQRGSREILRPPSDP